MQVIITTFATDRVNDPGPLAIVAASAALHVSDIPFQGPVGAVLVGHINDEFAVNPEMPSMNASRLDLIVAGTRDAVLMVEAGAHELTEDEVLQSVIEGHAVCKQLCDLQDELREQAGKEKRQFTPPASDTSLQEQVTEYVGERLRQAVNNPNKAVRQEATAALKQEVRRALQPGSAEPSSCPRGRRLVTKTFESLL